MSSTAVPKRAKSSKRVLPLEEARERMRDLHMTEPDGAAEPADHLTWGGMASKALDSYFAAPERGPRAEGDEFAEYVVRVVSPFLPEPKPAWYTPTLSAAATRVIAALRNTAPPTTPTYQERLLALKNKFPESPDESVAGEPAADLPAAEEPAPPVPSARTRSKAKGRV
ncbi:uncharacterized protein TRAVEDRAFT_48073, partial [Trametes versicolor FP-101664 SS1]|uniref:uncharacterized protein n=1 Tax=Trametes versicolor (strain FP-101664) TaxID=717944 RepID=UPI0004623AB9